MSTGSSTNTNTFINGKGQIVEMLAIMDGPHREQLLRNISVRDPALALELREKSLSVNVLEQLEDDELTAVFYHVPAQIWGLSLKDRCIDFQRRSLKLANKEYANEAFRTMKMSRITTEQIKRAQKRVIETVIELNRRNLLNVQ